MGNMSAAFIALALASAESMPPAPKVSQQNPVWSKGKYVHKCKGGLKPDSNRTIKQRKAKREKRKGSR